VRFVEPRRIDGVEHASSTTTLVSTSPHNSITKDGSIQLSRCRETTRDGNGDGDSKSKNACTPHGYLNGSFASGVTHEIRLEDGCFVLRYSETLLAVGTQEGLGLYETRNYNKVFHIPTGDEVSAIRWLEIDCCLPSQRLLGFGCLDVICFPYIVDDELLEVEGGISLVYKCRMDGQIRALDCCCHGKLDPTVVVTVGDGTGRLAVISLDNKTFEHVQTIDCEQHLSSVFCLSFQPD
jgi:hypothetical protein